MTKEEFYKCLTYFKVYYTKWDFDMSNNVALEIWYEEFETIPFEQFKDVVKSYCKTNQFPPKSPTDIANMIPRYYTMEDACEILRDVLRRNNLEYAKRELYEKHKVLYELTKGLLETELDKDSYGNQCIGYKVIRPFRKRYQELLDSVLHYESNQLVYTNLSLEMGCNK